MRKNIIVVEATSTGKFYISDVCNFGYNPIILEQKNPNWIQKYERETSYPYFKNNTVKIINECEDYRKTLEMVKKYDPVLIIPGFDFFCRAC